MWWSLIVPGILSLDLGAVRGLCAVCQNHLAECLHILPHSEVGRNGSRSDSRGHYLTHVFLMQLKLEDRSVVPRDVVRHMRSTVSPASPSAPLLGGCLGIVWAGSPMVAGTVCLLGLHAFSFAGQSVRHSDRRQHRLRRQAHRHQLHHLPCQQQGPPAHLGERPHCPPLRVPLRHPGSVLPAQGVAPAQVRRQSTAVGPCGCLVAWTPLLVSEPLRHGVGMHPYVSNAGCWCGFLGLFPFSPNIFFIFK